MTLEELFAALAQTPRRWRLYGHAIRLIDPETRRVDCPISAVANARQARGDTCGVPHWESESGYEAAAALWLPEDAVLPLILAADHGPAMLSLQPQAWRVRLLQACGLAEARPDEEGSR